ncbi:MAG TPA: NINE protein, partial [Bacteroidales bacterium]|nr:NINE protein [Bacteroidales bacterium]
IRIGHYRILISHGEESELSRKRSKLIAVAADLLTGPLGGHRIYLGTKPWVPVVYALTLGGGMGFLPVTDLFVIIFTSDLSKYTNNPQLIMWL